VVCAVVVLECFVCHFEYWNVKTVCVCEQLVVVFVFTYLYT